MKANMAKMGSGGKLAGDATKDKNPGLILPLGLVVLQLAVLKRMWGDEWQEMENPFGKGVSIIPPAIATVVYLVVIFVGQRVMEHKKPLDEFCKPYMLVYNLYQTVFNSWWVAMTVWEVYKLGYPIFCTKLTLTAEQFDLGFLIWLHYQNKYIEMLDTVFMVLRKKTRQVSFLHCYHHLLLLWSWFAVCKFGCGGEAYFGATINACIHVLMYGYYFLTTIKVPVPWKRYLTTMQMGQFVLCLSHSIWVAYAGIYPRELCALDMWVMVNMLYLFNRFYQQAYKKKRAAKKAAEKSAAAAAAEKKSPAGQKTDEGRHYVYLNGLKYDVTEFSARHPGGKVIGYYFNQDCTDAYNAFHRSSKYAAAVLKGLEKTTPADGEVPKQPKYIAEYRELLRKWTKMGLFKVNWAVMGIRMLEIVAGLVLAVYGARYSVVLSGVLAGYAWAKCGFLQHDAGHLGITGDSSVDILVQVVVEGFAKGGSAAWWRNRHNKHHAKPNVHSQDTDLVTLPFLSWDREHAKAAPKWLIRYQAYYFLPLLCFYVPIFFITTKLFMWRKKRPFEALVSLLHYVAFGSGLMVWSQLSLAQTVAWFLVGYAIQGVYLGFAFSLSHFAMPHIHTAEDAEKMDWVKLQCSTTLDFSRSEVVGWLTGHLNLQIEHHLCPTMPTMNYQYMRKDVEELCKKYPDDLKYTSMSCWEAIKLNFNTLDEVAKHRCAQKN
eukprot:CAMPEP_0114525712 /NCGR_PEP_ID=MMETSP0109-20121206/22589_1 /TAXON_ID=29199 /ORGANISM="Chlorarachnion reptans, Strain CCCM449" /LENGTH=711 /DNA_ID=CAMNT_0001707349 /DNA_START=40 /DNA_END=2175 /DNA_ORIENTATION=-